METTCAMNSNGSPTSFQPYKIQTSPDFRSQLYSYNQPFQNWTIGNLIFKKFGNPMFGIHASPVLTPFRKESLSKSNTVGIWKVEKFVFQKVKSATIVWISDLVCKNHLNAEPVFEHDTFSMWKQNGPAFIVVESNT